MKEKQTISQDKITNQMIACNTALEALTQEEQRKLIRGSYCHQYGVLIRLVMFTGLRMDELLGLQWDDVDIHNSHLYIRHKLAVDADGLGIRSASYPRIVPLPPHVLKDLMEWREERNCDVKSIIPFRWHPNSVATIITGYQINDKFLEGCFHQILQFCGLSRYPFGILRNTFAVRALEQGMDLRTLCRILGDPWAASTYAEVARENTEGNRARMETLLTVQPFDRTDLTYPVIATSLENGFTQLRAPNFPELTCAGPNLVDGLIIMREKIEDELHNSYCSPIPAPASDISCGIGECIIQISVKP